MVVCEFPESEVDELPVSEVYPELPVSEVYPESYDGVVSYWVLNAYVEVKSIPFVVAIFQDFR